MKPLPPAPAATQSLFRLMVDNPAARTYAMVSAGGLLAACTVLYLFLYSPFGAGVVFILGATGIVLRWSVSPTLFTLGTVYVLFFPAGLPGLEGIAPPIPDSHLLLADMMFVGAALVYLIGLYRYYATAVAGMPFEASKAFVKPGANPTVRPSVAVGDRELWMLFARAGVFVLLGQLLWLAVTELKLDFRYNFPITVHENNLSRNAKGGGSFADPRVSNETSRLLLTVGFFLTVGFVVWFVNWYWWLARMGRGEGQAVLLDTQWATARRDLNRPEAWRGRTLRRLNGTLPKKGFGTYFLVFGVPLLLFLLFVIAVGCAGGFR